jgi:hypothetical protein
MLLLVFEYLIRAEDGDFLVPHLDDLAATVHPEGRVCVRVDGAGEYRMRCDDLVVELNFEDPGIQVIVESDDEEAAGLLVDASAAQVTAAMARPTNVVPL